MWGGYFVLDFALRLLTIGIFLSLHNLWPYNLVIIVLLLLVYLLVVVIYTQVHNTELVQETWPGYRIQVRRVAQRFIDGLILTFFVHVLPADIRPAPKHHKESRLLFALHPELRTKLMRIIIPVRALDYLGLGFTSMWFRWDVWQCIALVTLYFTMHILLVLVMSAQRPSGLERQRTLEELPPEVFIARDGE
jgi:hypothetical protein